VGKLPSTTKQKTDAFQTKDKNAHAADDLPPELANFDKALIEKIEADIIHHGHPITFDDIAGLNFAKECVVETICW
jgi:hypothetical protein